MSLVGMHNVRSTNILRQVANNRVACPVPGCDSILKPASLQQHFKAVHYTSVMPPLVAAEVATLTRDARAQEKERLERTRRLMVREAAGIAGGALCPACDSAEVFSVSTIAEHVLGCGGQVTDEMRADAMVVKELDSRVRRNAKKAGISWVSDEAEVEEEMEALSGGPLENALLLPNAKIVCPIDECGKEVMRKGFHAHCLRAHDLSDEVEEQVKAFRNIACRYHMRRRNSGAR